MIPQVDEKSHNVKVRAGIPALFKEGILCRAWIWILNAWQRTVLIPVLTYYKKEDIILMKKNIKEDLCQDILNGIR